MANRDVGWDNVVALSYAAEQLFMAAQLLTSDTVPRDHAVRETCNRYLASLTAHADLLPAYIITWIRECQRHCERLRAGGAPSEEGVHQLSSAIATLLDDIRSVLKSIEQQPDGGEAAA